MGTDMATSSKFNHLNVGFPPDQQWIKPRSLDITPHNFLVDHDTRVASKGHESAVLWFTGISASGKSSIANAVDKKLNELAAHTYLLDGDNIRTGLNSDLGFDDYDRIENIRRIAEVSKLMVDAGLIVMTAFISPFISERERARSLFKRHEFIEIFVDTPMSIAEARDPKGLYKKAREGAIKKFTGIDSIYERPQNPEIHIDTTKHSIEDAANRVVDYLVSKNLFKGRFI